jgi:hypothetical protein
MPITNKTLTATYLDPSGNPLSGYVTFTPTAELRNPGIPSSIRPVVPALAILDSSGHISVTLAANTDSDTLPALQAYIVNEYIGADTYVYAIQISAYAPATIDLASLAPVGNQGSTYFGAYTADFEEQVRAVSPDQLALMGAALNFNGQKAINMDASALALPAYSAAIASDVAIPAAGAAPGTTLCTSPALAYGAGYLAFGSATILQGGSAGVAELALENGTGTFTTYNLAATSTEASIAANAYDSLAFTGLIQCTAAGTIKLCARDTTAATAKGSTNTLGGPAGGMVFLKIL